MSQVQMIVITSVGWFVAVLALVYAFVVSAVNSQVQDTNESLRESQPADVADLERRLRQSESENADNRLEIDTLQERNTIQEAEIRELRRELWEEKKRIRDAARLLGVPQVPELAERAG